MERSKALVIDDEPQDLKDTSETLEKLGFEVYKAKDPNHGMEILNKMSCGTVLLDLVLPGMDGFEVYTKIRETYPDTRFVIVTGFGYDPGHSMVNIKREIDCPVVFKPVSQNLGRLKQVFGVDQDV